MLNAKRTLGQKGLRWTGGSETADLGAAPELLQWNRERVEARRPEGASTGGPCAALYIFPLKPPLLRLRHPGRCLSTLNAFMLDSGGGGGVSGRLSRLISPVKFTPFHRLSVAALPVASSPRGRTPRSVAGNRRASPFPSCERRPRMNGEGCIGKGVFCRPQMLRRLLDGSPSFSQPGNQDDRWD